MNNHPCFALIALLLTSSLAAVSVHGADTEQDQVTIKKLDDASYLIENNSMARQLSMKDGVLRTSAIINKLAKTRAVPTACNEFELRISKGTHTTGTDVLLTSADFRCTESSEYTPAKPPNAKGVSFLLKNEKHQLTVKAHYELTPGDFYLRKYLTITPAKPVTVERFDIESIQLEDAHQPYTVRAIYARGKWSPGLGQPLYGKASGTFWGIEFPAADNSVKDKTLRCSYLRGLELPAGKPYQTYPAVVGVSDNPKFNTDAFFDYIDRVRIRPLRLQIQYNTWFDTGRGVNKNSFRQSVNHIHKKLCVERKCKPLKTYVVDDGWQDIRKDWTQKTWQVNAKFDPDFAFSSETVKAADSTLGIWMSPGCLFGSNGAVKPYRKKGFEALTNWMSLAGPKYMGLLENRMVELTKQGVTYFKLDGLFGHLNLRNFELHGDRYGIPHMPQLGLEGFQDGDKRLNNSKYDELKIYYLTAGTERLIQIFQKMAAVNPDVYIVISNGAYLSPWWLMHTDSIWMINAGDAAGGSSRTQELVYRDDRYHEIYAKEKTQFPMHALFNHEPKKTKTGESQDVFRKYLYMNISRGTGFIELYIKPRVLKEHDWDVLAEGLHWSYHVFPTFKRSRMHGGSPKAGEVYGYTAWTKERGYVSIHNPSGNEKPYQFTLDRTFGLLPDSGTYLLSSPMDDCVKDLEKEYAYGSTVSLKLQPREIRILNFDKTPVDWSVLKELQKRNKGPESPRPPKSVHIDNHLILGIWDYTHNGQRYSREFTKDGFCIFREGKAQKQSWKKPFKVTDDKTAVIEGRYRHVLKEKNTLLIEGRYQATRR